MSLIVRLFKLLVEFVGNLLRFLARYHVYRRLLLTLLLGLDHTRRLMDIFGRSVMRLYLGCFLVNLALGLLAVSQVVQVEAGHWVWTLLLFKWIGDQVLVEARALIRSLQARLATHLFMEAFKTFEGLCVHVEGVEHIRINRLLIADAQTLVISTSLIVALLPDGRLDFGAQVNCPALVKLLLI